MFCNAKLSTYILILSILFTLKTCLTLYKLLFLLIYFLFYEKREPSFNNFFVFVTDIQQTIYIYFIANIEISGINNLLVKIFSLFAVTCK